MTSSEPQFVFAHGFTQTGRSWENVERRLRAAIPDYRTTAVDLPGHGDAPPSLATADLWRSADHLVERGGRGIYVGYSMGGRVALHAALAHPDAVEALVLIGATGGIDNPHERSKRRADDERLADRIEQIGVDDFLTEWLAKPLFVGLTNETAQLADRRRNTAAGLASSLRFLGQEDEARAAASEVLRINPRFTLKAWSAHVPYNNKEMRERNLTAFRKAGLPE